MRRDVPTIVTTFDADVVTVGPAPAVAGSSVTVTSAGAIVPDGKFEPVTLTLVTPACPVDGLTAVLSVTLVCASSSESDPAMPTAAVRTAMKLFFPGMSTDSGFRGRTSEPREDYPRHSH